MISSLKPLAAATLAGLVIVGAAGLAVKPVMAAGYPVDAPARVTRVAPGDVLNVRRWPAAWSRLVGTLRNGARVEVDRCIIAPQGGSDWCLVSTPRVEGWVSRRYLRFLTH